MVGRAGHEALCGTGAGVRFFLGGNEGLDPADGVRRTGARAGCALCASAEQSNDHNKTEIDSLHRIHPEARRALAIAQGDLNLQVFAGGDFAFRS